MSRTLALLTTAIACLLPSRAAGVDNPAERARSLVAVLESNAPLFDKARACQQLGEFGGPEAVPALAALLGDEHLSAYARSGLEGIPDPRAARALREAATLLTGDQLVGVVNSLGVLRDAGAVGLLRRLAADPDSTAAGPALLALGRIGTVESITVVVTALTAGAPDSRNSAAAACLIAAEQRLGDGDPEMAKTIYDGLRTAEVPSIYRAAAARGAIVVRGEEGVPLLLEELDSADPLFRQAALAAIRSIPSDRLAGALNGVIDRLPGATQVQVLIAILDCHNVDSLRVLERKATGEDPEVRQTALRVLGRIGGGAQVNVLLQTVAAPRSAGDAEIALSSLRRMEGGDVDAQIARSLGSTQAPGARIELIHLLDDRGAEGCSAELLEQAGDSEVKVAVAALRALQSSAGPDELPALMALLRTSQDEARRVATENAVAGICLRTGRVAQGSGAALVELKQARDPVLKNSWTRILVALGDPQALPVLLGAIRSDDPAVASFTVEELARWPSPAPMEALLEVARNAPEAAQRRRALASSLRLATTAAEERQSSPETLVEWFRLANQAAETTAERRRVLSGLGRVAHAQAVQLLVPYLDDPSLRSEAAVAIVQIAPALRGQNSAGLKAALEKIAGTADNADLRRQAAEIGASIGR